MIDLNFLTIEDALELHFLQTERYGGAASVPDLQRLKMSLAVPLDEEDLGHNVFFYIAASYIFYVARDRPFLDGNSRTALLLGLVFLKRHGISINDPNNEIVTAVESARLEQISVFELAEILMNMSKSYD